MKHLVSSDLAVLQSNVISTFTSKVLYLYTILMYLYLQFSPTLYFYSAKLLLSTSYSDSQI